jgi:hypothetical protein
VIRLGLLHRPLVDSESLWLTAEVSGLLEEDARGALRVAQDLAAGIVGRPLVRSLVTEQFVVDHTGERLPLSLRPVEAVLQPAGCSLYTEAGLVGGPWVACDTVAVEYVAGWIPPAAVVSWTSSTSIAAGAWCELGAVLWTATTAGTSGATKPVPSGFTAPLVDGSVTWTPTTAHPMPKHFQQVLRLAARVLYDRGSRPADLAAVEIGSYKETYRATVGEAEKVALLPLSLVAALEIYR